MHNREECIPLARVFNEETHSLTTPSPREILDKKLCNSPSDWAAWQRQPSNRLKVPPQIRFHQQVPKDLRHRHGIVPVHTTAVGAQDKLSTPVLLEQTEGAKDEMRSDMAWCRVMCSWASPAAEAPGAWALGIVYVSSWRPTTNALADGILTKHAVSG